MKERSKPVNILLWLAQILIAALFVTVGLGKFLGMMDAQFEAWGYPPGFAAGVGLLEIVGAAGLLFKRTAGWSALGLMLLMIGAAWTHFVYGEYVALAAPGSVFVVLGLIAWGRGLTVHTIEPREPATSAY